MTRAFSPAWPLACFVLAAAGRALAQPCPEFTGPEIRVAQADELSAVMRHLERDKRQDVTVLDSFYVLELSESGGTIRARGRRWAHPTEERLRRVSDLYLACVSPGASGTFSDYLRKLREALPSLDGEDRLLLLSMLGETLDQARPETPSREGADPERLLKSLRSGEKHPGGSEQVHLFLAHVARELGFRDVLPGQTLEFRHPRTGEIHVQSYSGILATGKADAEKARRLAARAEDLGSGTFRPRTGSWADLSLHGVWKTPSASARYEQLLSETESTRGTSFGSGPTRSFVMHSELLKSESISSVTAVGSYSLDLSYKPQKLSEEQLKEQHNIVRTMHREIPLAPPAPASSNLPGSWELTPQGKLKLNLPGVDGKPIRINSGIKGNGTVHDVGSGFTLTEPVGNLPIAIDINRTFALGPDKSKASTVDKFNVFIDGSDSKRSRPYLSYDGTVYVYQGVENMSHAGMVSRLKAAIPDGNKGDFYTMVRMSDVIADRTGMSSETRKGLGVGAGYRKMLSDFVELDAQVEMNNGASVHDTLTIGSDAKAGKQVSGSVFIKIKW